jgi:large repetitive protein
MFKKMIKIAGVVAVLGCVSTAMATVYTLTDHNATATVDPASSAGMSAWNIDGVNQLHQQWFWFRVGSSGSQASIDTVSAPTVTTPAANIINMSYQNASFQVNLSYTLTGGSAGSGFSDISESISIFNKSTTTPLDFHFFQYSDFDLGGTSANDYGQYVGNGKINQWDPTAALILSETVSSRTPNHYQISTYPTLLNSLNNTPGYTLSDTPTPVGTTTGPGDLTWGFEWDLTIAANGSVVWSKDKTISKSSSVPDSGTTIMLLGAALTGLAMLRRRLSR